jgi:crotonobetainyl-CoA:carnitine CoA-transferase CaiB-like acyl-CoA transferase
MHALQNAGVPAAAMNRVNDLLVDEHLLAREFYVTMHQPQIGDIPTESGPARFSHLPGAFHRPAPLQGEQTRFIAKELLALSDLDIERLVDKGILQVPAEPAEPR